MLVNSVLYVVWCNSRASLWHSSLCRTCCRWRQWAEKVQCLQSLFSYSLWFLFSASCVVRFCSPLLVPFWTVSLQQSRSSAFISQLFVSMPVIFVSRLSVSVTEIWTTSAPRPSDKFTVHRLTYDRQPQAQRKMPSTFNAALIVSNSNIIVFS